MKDNSYETENKQKVKVLKPKIKNEAELDKIEITAKTIRDEVTFAQGAVKDCSLEALQAENLVFGQCC